ncbi:MAG: sulfite exporter TauE/SafE family protein [Chloroflexi bacterium]|nr:MAG: sulfite exporter TauE/SafE family protein [Chloroflexota bacterium]
MNLASALLLIAGGVAAGFINTIAGSGSLITLPLLIFAGLPATIANGSNRVAVLAQSFVAVQSFRRGGVLDIRKSLTLIVPAALGALLGAQIAVKMDEVLMRRAIGVLMIGMLIITVLRSRGWGAAAPGHRKAARVELQVLLFFAIGVYGGFIQAGVGVLLLMAILVATPLDLVAGNATKNLIVLVFTIFALAVFVYNRQVDWAAGFVLSIGNAAGAWLGARLSLKHGAPLVQALLIVVVVASAADLLGVFRYLAQLVALP